MISAIIPLGWYNFFTVFLQFPFGYKLLTILKLCELCWISFPRLFLVLVVSGYLISLWSLTCRFLQFQGGSSATRSYSAKQLAGKRTQSRLPPCRLKFPNIRLQFVPESSAGHACRHVTPWLTCRCRASAAGDLSRITSRECHPVWVATGAAMQLPRVSDWMVVSCDLCCSFLPSSWRPEIPPGRKWE